MSNVDDWLPELITLEQAGGDWSAYLETIYAVFRRDWCGPRPLFNGRRVMLKRHPVIQGKEATFWHFISEGSVEEDRLPDLRRSERIGWPRPIVEAHPNTSRLRYWQTERRGETRHLLALANFSYVVVIADRGDYLLPWTAFDVDRPHRRTKLQNEWKEWQAKNKLEPPP